IPGNGQEPLWYAAGEVSRDSVLLYPILQGELEIEHLPEAPGIELDDDLLRVGACFVAEGSVGGSIETPRELFFSFGSHEEELAERIAGILRSYKISVSIRKRPERHTCEVLVFSTQIASLFVRMFGRRAKNKRLPH